jgi:hypothetical protein
MFGTQLKKATDAGGKLLERRRKAQETQADSQIKAAVIEGELEAIKADRAAAEVKSTLDGNAEGLSELRTHEAEKRSELERLQALDRGLDVEIIRMEDDIPAVINELNAAREEHMLAERAKLAEKIRTSFADLAPLLNRFAAEAFGRGDTVVENWILNLKIPDPENDHQDLFNGQRQEADNGTLRPVPVWTGDAAAEKAFDRESGPRVVAEQLGQLANKIRQKQSTERRLEDERRFAERRNARGYVAGPPMYVGRSNPDPDEEQPQPPAARHLAVQTPDGRMKPIDSKQFVPAGENAEE